MRVHKALIILLIGLSLPVSAASTPVQPHITAVVFVIDTSGSMNNTWEGGLKLQSARTAIINLLDLMIEENQLPDRDYYVSLIQFADQASLVVPLTQDLDQVRTAVSTLTAHGYTNIGDGLQLAYRELERQTFDRGFILLLSDGMTNRGRSSDQITHWLTTVQTPQASVYGIDFTIRTDVPAAQAAKDIDTIPLARQAADTLTTANMTANLHINAAHKDALAALPEDAVFAFYGHANVDRLAFIDSAGNKTLLLTRNITSLPLLSLQLAVLAGCLTADDSSNKTSITQTFLNQGARCVVGFSEKVNWIGYQHWSDHFWPTLADGNNVYDAARIGTIQTLIEDSSTPLVTHKLDSRVVRTLPSADARKLTLSDISSVPTHRPVYTLGFGDALDLDEPLLQTIADTTGGSYSYGADADILQNLFLLTQHEATGTVLGEYEGQLHPGEDKNVGSFAVEPGSGELRVSLNWPGSHIDLKLHDPRGRIVNPDYPGVVIWRTQRPGYVVIERPVSGRWTVNLIGSDVSPRGTPFHVAASISDVGPVPSSVLEFLVITAVIALLAVVFIPFMIGIRHTREVHPS